MRDRAARQSLIGAEQKDPRQRLAAAQPVQACIGGSRQQQQGGAVRCVPPTTGGACRKLPFRGDRPMRWGQRVGGDPFGIHHLAGPPGQFRFVVRIGSA